MTETLETVGIAALAFGILRVLEKAITGLLEKRKNGNGNSGEKSIEFWEKRFDNIDNSMSALAKDVANLRSWLGDSMTDIKSALSTLIRWKGGD